MWDNDFDPYNLLIDTHANTLKLGANQQELNRNQQVLERSDHEIAKMLNAQSETIKQILEQNRQLNDMIKRTRIQMDLLNTEIHQLRLKQPQ